MDKQPIEVIAKEISGAIRYKASLTNFLTQYLPDSSAIPSFQKNRTKYETLLAYFTSLAPTELNVTLGKALVERG